MTEEAPGARLHLWERTSPALHLSAGMPWVPEGFVVRIRPTSMSRFDLVFSMVNLNVAALSLFETCPGREPAV